MDVSENWFFSCEMSDPVPWVMVERAVLVQKAGRGRAALFLLTVEIILHNLCCCVTMEDVVSKFAGG